MADQPVGSSREFPLGAASPPALDRRDFVKLLGASVALASLNGCIREPDQEILPYVTTPADAVPGVPRHYATAMTIDGYATGLLVESRDGRPTKIEGNPDHPASLGAAGAFEQASLLQLYDPHRARVARAGSRNTTWDAARAAFSPETLSKRVGARGAGLRLLLEPTSSPLIAAWLDRVRERYPDSRAYFYAPLASASAVGASRTAFGAALVPRYDLTRADVVVSFDDDLLASGPFHLRYARDFSTRRRITPSAELFVAETAPSPTGTLADHRLGAAPSSIARLVAALFDIVVSGAKINRADAALTEAEWSWVVAATGALTRSGARSLVIAGSRQPAEIYVLIHALNARLSALGTTVAYVASPIVGADDASHGITGLAALAAELEPKNVDTLVALESNPCYTAPADADFARRMRAVPNTLCLGLYADETASASTWHLPLAHYLESWGDTRAYDGTESIVQPLVAPLYDGHTVAEMLAVIAGASLPSHDLMRQLWGSRAEASWNDSLRRGVVDGSALPTVTPTLRPDVADAARHSLALSTARTRTTDALEIVISPSRSVYDGRFGDNAWLQELPDPITKLTWDNAALISPERAAQGAIESGDVVALTIGGRTIEVPALIVPGHATAAVSVAIGYGRAGAEAIARGVGVNVNSLRTVAAPFSSAGLQLRKTAKHAALAVTQSHWSIEGRGESVLGKSAAAATAPPDSTKTPPRKRRPLTLYEPPAPASTGFGADQWAMTIDLDQCTGCSACVIACQAENNVPVVGKEGVLASREMHWLRIDRYIDGPPEAPTFDTQPMLCQHCEKAPCEYVCPVNATVHSDDGLNEMVYNRCVGTRFCSNNCPYKVRRFNWFDYNDELTPVEQMIKNPQVTVRQRGVMEKCTFCVQRVRRAQMDADLAGAPHTGQVQTACQQTCPSQAIVFGSLTAPSSEVARLSNDPRAFSALDDLGTVPRVRYLARRRDRGA